MPTPVSYAHLKRQGRAYRRVSTSGRTVLGCVPTITERELGALATEAGIETRRKDWADEMERYVAEHLGGSMKYRDG